MIYYIKQNGNLYELRQTRFRHLPYVHPHDVCAVGRSVEGILMMYDAYLSGGVEGHRQP